MDQADVIDATVLVVGAGPAGSAAALRLAQQGVKDVVLVDVHDFPRDKTCGSGLSPRAIKLLRSLDVWRAIEPIAYPIVGLHLVTPGGQVADLADPGEESHAAICLRRDMDFEIHKAALAAGVRFLPGFRATEPLVRDGRWLGMKAADGRSVRARYTIVANGAHSQFTDNTSAKKMIHTIMGWWEDVEFRPHYIEMYYDPMLAPYYGWLFPESPNRVNIGITYPDDDKNKNARALFQNFLDKYFADRLPAGRQIGKLKGHPILYSYRLGRLARPGRIIIGEAGRMTHPATGEGIYQGMQSGVFAADALRDILLAGSSETTALATYELKCSRTFLPSFWAGGLFRGVIQTPAVDWVVRFGNLPRVRSTMRQILTHL